MLHVANVSRAGRMLSAVVCLTVLAVVPVSLSAADAVAVIDWTTAESGDRSSGELVADERFPRVLLIDHVQSQPLSVAVFDRQLPSTPQYAVRGFIRYENVDADSQPGFLESWQSFADGGRYFTRTLAGHGPMGALSGTSDWGEFSLPFQGRAETGPPVSIEARLVLPSRGKVWLGLIRGV